MTEFWISRTHYHNISVHQLKMYLSVCIIFVSAFVEMALMKDSVLSIFHNTPFAGVTIRITSDGKYASVIDFIGIVSESIAARFVWQKIKKRFNEMAENLGYQETPVIITHQFNGKRQRPTPVVTARGIMELLYMIPGRKASEFRRQGCEILIRYMGGDESLIAEIYINRNAANNVETANAFFKANVQHNNIQSKEEAELERYAAKLELDFQYEEKRYAQQVKRDEQQVKRDKHDIQVLAEKTEIQKQLYKAAMIHVSYPPARTHLIPEITILSKNEELSAGGDYKKYQHMEFFIFRCQRRATPKALKLFKRKYPKSQVVLEKVYHANPISFFNGCQEKVLMRRYGNHFTIDGKQSIDDKVKLIKEMYDKLTVLNNTQTIVCLNKSV
jgi:Protein of unknown function (DUF3627)